MITPTIGRVVWFWPAPENKDTPVSEKPFAAIIAYVWGERMVNLIAFDHNGNPEPHTSVTLLQDSDQKPSLGYCAEWPMK